ncbi:MAG TPA: GPW/gp25 family protein [Burkholderiaceae bacterium]
MDTDKSFLGTGWGFPPEFSRSEGAVRMVSGAEDIEESLRILLATVPQERIMQPAYGCGMKKHVFDTISETTLTLLKDAISRAVLFFEPRIDLKRIDIDEAGAMEGVLLIDLQYVVRATNSRSNLVYPFYFREATNNVD